MTLESSSSNIKKDSIASVGNLSLSVHLRYRPAIDGLRAIAVGAVFLFHLNRRLLPGGFVGVDVFFVISGYLITSILLKDFDQHRFSLATFYQRRIARIFPAMFCVGIAIIIAAALIYLPQDLASAGVNFSAAMLSVANLKLMFQGNYFQLSPDAQPFLHYWSLSVEEQFYLLFPALLFLLLRYFRSLAFVVLSALLVASCLLSIFLTRSHQTWAFYLLPTRAWELMTGCLLAIGCNSNAKVEIRREAVLGFSALALVTIGLSFSLIRENFAFPGILPLPAVLGTAVLLWPAINTHPALEGWLGGYPIAAVGRASYSLYLWHWPVFCFVDYALFAGNAYLRLFLKITLAILLATLSYLALERPTRRFLNARRHRSSALAFVVISLVVAIAVGTVIRRNNYINADLRDVLRGGIVINQSSHSGTVMLMGDSNASMYAKTLKEICVDLDKELIVISVAAGDPLPSADASSSNPLWDASVAAAKRYHPDVLVLACEWRGKLVGNYSRLVTALNVLQPHVGHVVILNEPPALPEQATRNAVRGGSKPPFFEDSDLRRVRTSVNDWLSKLGSSKVTIVDVSSCLSIGDGRIRVIANGKQLYQDSGHLSPYGAELIRSQLEYLFRSSGDSNELQAAGLTQKSKFALPQKKAPAAQTSPPP